MSLRLFVQRFYIMKFASFELFTAVWLCNYVLLVYIILHSQVYGAVPRFILNL